ncbi:hypothetical protein SNE26_00485 [Mucilaginibacter sp. cycad4]|uniref:hypothetical protein n=1 Tax=Mucilaginibacter sp. cycad4 TaxID=3342096 RepID=UPI002AAB2539|nr:hypothetical protein [Mucilaginibacter gossypii]WPV00238.1 hypothetical protein SNE26_00485 [Mucilaginibacter gossypii]
MVGSAILRKPEKKGFANNIGIGEGVIIKELSLLIKKIGNEGEIVFDISKTDGAPRKLMDVAKPAGDITPDLKTALH